jgi:molybdenum cofactor guanylyltransferase
MGSTVPLTGIILAGGEGRRMDGQDKGWIELHGKPLIRHVLDRLQPQVSSRCIISANRNLERYRALGVPVVTDAEVYLGPLAGIAHALQHIDTDYALVVPTDAPLVPLDLATRLQNELPAKLVICHDGERLQPLFGIFHRSLSESIFQFLHSGQRQLTRWCMEQSPKTVTIGDTFAFANLNTAEELARIGTHLDNPQT